MLLKLLLIIGNSGQLVFLSLNLKVICFENISTRRGFLRFVTLSYVCEIFPDPKQNEQ